jgi:uncharacterized protein YbjT (DUF2867 family)
MKALIIGSTGLVGGHILNQLLDSQYYEAIICLVRKPSSISHAKLTQIVFDFENPDPSLIKADHIYCAIGTTLAKAGSKERQFKIDCTYPTEIATIAVKNGATHFALVSSVGANSSSGNFYLSTKGKLEDAILKLNFPHVIMARPSFILGERPETRIGEKIGIVIMKLLNPIIFGSFKKYKAIEASVIALSLIKNTIKSEVAIQILESPDIE